MLVVGSLAAPAAAQRLRSPSSSLVLATPTVTCGTSPQVNLSWTDSQSTSTATYAVMSLPSGGKQSAWSEGALLGNVRSTSVSAANGSTWEFAIRGITSVTRDSNVVTISINCPPADTTPPGVPTITSATATSCSATTLAWTAVTDTGGSGLAGYNLWQNGSFVQRVSAPATSWAFSGLAASTVYSYQVSAIDGAGNQSAKSTAVSVTTPACANKPPVANAGPDQTGLTLVAFTFNGSGSSDPDGTIASYSWNFGDGSAAGSGVSTTHTYAHAGTYTVTLTVADNLGATGIDTAIATVQNRVPIANAGPDQTGTVGTALTFNGSGSSDSDGTIASYSWNFGDGSAGASGVNVSHAYSATGTYTVTLTVTDNNGATATDTAIATIGTVANKPPVANAGADQTAQTLVSLTFNGSGSSDPDGTIASYSWSFGDGSAAATGVSVTHSYAHAGTYTVTLTVTDNLGATGTDTAVATISDRPPVANAGPDQTSSTLISLTFSGSGSSDPDGTITSYSWNFGDGSALASGVGVNHTYMTAGTYTVTLTVTDNNGATATDTAIATIVNRPPVANAGPDQTAPSLTTLTFNGSGSSDADGTIVSYSWNFGDGSATASGVSVTHAFAHAGLYTVVLTVIDNNGASTNDTAAANITDVPPVANAGPDQSAQAGIALSFNGSGSSDADGTITAYSWNFGDGSATASGVTASHTYSTAGTYSVTLTVTDNNGVTGTDTAVATISSASSGLQLTGFVPGVGTAHAVVVSPAGGHTAYVASQEFGLSIVDISNPSAPVTLGAANPPFEGLDVAVSGSVAVVDAGVTGLRVVDVSQPSTPKTVGVMTSAALGGSSVSGVAISGITAYVLVSVAGNPGHTDVVVVNVATPSAPAILGRVSVTGGTHIHVVGTRAYVSEGIAGFGIVDVSTPSSPKLLGSVDTPGTADDVAVSGNTAFVADNSSVQVVNIATPTAPTIVTSLADTAAAAVVSGNRLYTTDGGSFRVFDITTPAAPTLLNSSNSFGSQNLDITGSNVLLADPDVTSTTGGLYIENVSSLPPVVTAQVYDFNGESGVAVSGTLAVVGGVKTFKVVSLANPAVPVVTGSLTATALGGASLINVAINGTTAYALVSVGGNPGHTDLVVIDVSTPSAPAIRGRVSLTAGDALALSGSYAYVAAATAGFAVVNISNPASPTIASTLAFGAGTATDVKVAGGYAYVADSSSLQVVNIANPAAPTIATTLANSGSAASILGSRLYTTDGGTFRIYDITTPSSPVQLSATTSYGATGVAVIGTTAYLDTPAQAHSDANGGVRVVNVSNPASPRVVQQLIVPGLSHEVITDGTNVYASDYNALVDVMKP
jgi:chitodextrinase